MNFILEQIEKFDIIGPSPGLSHKNSSRYSTLFGSLLSLLVIGYSMYSVSDQAQDAYFSTNPYINSQTDFNDQTFNFNNSNFKFFLQIKYFDTRNNAVIAINKTDLPKILIQNIDFNDTYFVKTDIQSEQKFLVNCPKELFANYKKETPYESTNIDDIISDNEIEDIRQKSLCFPEELSRVLQLRRRKKTGILISLFYNETKRIISKYGGTTLIVSLKYLEKIVRPNAGQKIKRTWTQVDLPVKFNETHQVNIKLTNETTIIDKTKMLVPDVDCDSEYFAESITDMLQFPRLDIDEFNLNFWFLFFLSDHNYTNTLTYPSYTDVVGNMGGIIGIFLPMIEVLYSIIITPQYNCSRLNTVFNFHTNEKSYKKPVLLSRFMNMTMEKRTHSSGLPKNHSDSDQKQVFKKEKISSDWNFYKNENSEAKTENDNLKLHIKENDYSLEDIPDKIEDEHQIGLEISQGIKDKKVENISYNNVFINKTNESNTNQVQVVSIQLKELKKKKISNDLSLKEIKNDLYESLLMKTKQKVSYCDICKISFKCCVKLDPRLETIEKFIEFIDTTLNEENITKTKLWLMLINDIYFKDQSKFVSLPSINVDSEENPYFIRHILEHEEDDNSEHNLQRDNVTEKVDELETLDFKDSKSKRLLENYMNNYL